VQSSPGCRGRRPAVVGVDDLDLDVRVNLADGGDPLVDGSSVPVWNDTGLVSVMP
jgi:hypothetical protein